MRIASVVAMIGVVLASRAAAQDTTVVRQGDSVVVRLVDVDLRSAVSLLAPYLDHPVVFGNIQPVRVTLESPRPMHQRDVQRMLRAIVEAQNMELALDTAAGVLRVRPREVNRTSGPPANSPRPTSVQPGAPELFVVRLRHARASDVAGMVNALFGKAGAVGEPGAPAPTLSQELRQNVVPPAGALPQSIPGATGRAATLAGEITIVPDPSTNSLLVRAQRPDFQLIEAAIQQIDVRPLQVLIEVVIAEVRRDQQFALGLEATVPKNAVGTGGTSISATNAGIGLGDFVLRVMNVGGIDADLVLRAAASRGDVRIVSRPVVLAANNQTADITVGSQRPFVQVSRSLPTDAPQRDQVVQYKDVGTQLTVKPTISADGYVMLQVTQQVNQATAEVAFDAPIISTRSVQTQLLVKDGQTVVIGGMSDRERDVTSSGIPVLSRIPIIGGLFGAHSRRASDTELFLFLKPVVLFTDDDAQRATEAVRQRTGATIPPPHP
jgi:general secretion pathway protein D